MAVNDSAKWQRKMTVSPLARHGHGGPFGGPPPSWRGQRRWRKKRRGRRRQPQGSPFSQSGEGGVEGEGGGFMAVVCPDGVGAGDLIVLATPDGREVEVGLYPIVTLGKQ